MDDGDGRTEKNQKETVMVHQFKASGSRLVTARYPCLCINFLKVENDSSDKLLRSVNCGLAHGVAHACFRSRQ